MLKLSKVLHKSFRNCSSPLCVAKLKSFSTPAFVEEKQVADNRFENENKLQSVKVSKNMVAAAFASLNSANQPIDSINNSFIEDSLSKATNVEQLLALTDGNGISRKYALRIVSVFAEWSSIGKIKLSDFENDVRFIKLCRVLTKGAKTRSSVPRSEDLSTILNVTADDEAARLVESITLPQMVKVMTTLSQKRRRSLLLLRSLAYNITASNEILDLKQSADLLYSICQLNFLDENLMAKVCADVCSELKKDVKRSSVVGSILTSLGLLKYKDPETLDVLSNWILNNSALCRPQDIFSLFVTMAVLNYTPVNSPKIFEVLLPQLCSSETGKPLIWLNIVWSLVLLNKASSEHISSVLTEEFVNRLEGHKALNTATKLKLLNINGAALHLHKEYQGPKLSSSSSINNVNLGRTREKTEMVESLSDSLKNLIKSDRHLCSNVNTGLGFYIDAKCVLDQKGLPLPLTEGAEDRKDVIRIAFLAFDYHDMCRGNVTPTGLNNFITQILEAQDYKVFKIPYTEFKVNDKLIHRVQYLEAKIKTLVK